MRRQVRHIESTEASPRESPSTEKRGRHDILLSHHVLLCICNTSTSCCHPHQSNLLLSYIGKNGLYLYEMHVMFFCCTHSPTVCFGISSSWLILSPPLRSFLPLLPSHHATSICFNMLQSS